MQSHASGDRRPSVDIRVAATRARGAVQRKIDRSWALHGFIVACAGQDEREGQDGQDGKSRPSRDADPLSSFLVAACAPLDAWHASGTLDEARAILASHPELAGATIYAAAVLGDDESVRRFLALDNASATAKGGPHDWDPLTYLCFSRFLRLDSTRSEAFVRTARVLLDAGARANTGFFERNHQPAPSSKRDHGAAGVAHHPSRVAARARREPNAGDAYHVIETHDNRAMQIRRKRNSPPIAWRRSCCGSTIGTYDGIKWLLEHGASPTPSRVGKSPFYQAVQCDNSIEIPGCLRSRCRSDNRGGNGLAGGRGARAGGRRSNSRSVGFGSLRGVDRLIAACAMNDADIRRLSRRSRRSLATSWLKRAVDRKFAEKRKRERRAAA
jgi:hypothetical protein